MHGYVMQKLSRAQEKGDKCTDAGQLDPGSRDSKLPGSMEAAQQLKYCSRCYRSTVSHLFHSFELQVGQS